MALTDEYHASVGRPPEQRVAILRRLLGSVADDAFFEPSFRCEFGFNIHLGRRFYANFDCVILDGATVTIGDNALLGPRVGIYTSNHALDPAERAAGWCYAKPVTLGDDVWIGGGVSIMQGVEIGAGSVIAAGSVVTRSIPAGCIARRRAVRGDPDHRRELVGAGLGGRERRHRRWS